MRVINDLLGLTLLGPTICLYLAQFRQRLLAYDNNELVISVTLIVHQVFTSTTFRSAKCSDVVFLLGQRVLAKQAAVFRTDLDIKRAPSF